MEASSEYSGHNQIHFLRASARAIALAEAWALPGLADIRR